MKHNQITNSQHSPVEEEIGSRGSLAAGHPSLPTLPVLAAPSHGGRGKNTIRMELVTVACLRLHGDCFAFGSSFLAPDSQDEFRALAKLRRAHPGAPLSIFGHADPVGDDATNKALSGHRAESVLAVLLHDPARWEKRYVASGPNEGWGSGSIQTMLATLGYQPTPSPASPQAAAKAAIEQFQRRNDLVVDGLAGPRTRDKLFLEYMTFLSPEQAQKADFLGAGRDSAGKCDAQGCGEFNPVMTFGKDELQELQKPENKALRDRENSVNRRVVVLLFRPGVEIPPDKWPCPRTSEGAGGCRKRFWSDADSRRAATDARRTFGGTKNTFACRFYQRLVNDSPCELRDGKAKLLDRMTISFVLANANQVSTEYPKYLLRSTDGAYQRELTPQNDLVSSDQYLQVRFENLLPGKRYTLLREDSPSITEIVFDDVPFDAIVDQERESNSSLTDHAYALAGLTVSDSFAFDWTA